MKKTVSNNSIANAKIKLTTFIFCLLLALEQKKNFSFFRMWRLFYDADFHLDSSGPVCSLSPGNGKAAYVMQRISYSSLLNKISKHFKVCFVWEDGELITPGIFKNNHNIFFRDNRTRRRYIFNLPFETYTPRQGTYVEMFKKKTKYLEGVSAQEVRDRYSGTTLKEACLAQVSAKALGLPGIIPDQGYLLCTDTQITIRKRTFVPMLSREYVAGEKKEMLRIYLVEKNFSGGNIVVMPIQYYSV